MMERVQAKGGKAMFAQFGTPTAGGHHNAAFDVDERVMENAANFWFEMYKTVTA